MADINELKAKLLAIIDEYKKVNQAKTVEFKNPTEQANKTLAAPTSKIISDTVGENGKNKPEDVLLIKTLLNKFGAGLDLKIANCGPKTIEAIKNYQKTKAGLKNPDGLISPNGTTWKALNGSATPPINNTTPINNTNPLPVQPVQPVPVVPEGGLTTWDKHTNARIGTLDSRLKAAAAAFINDAQKELGLKLRITSGFRDLKEQDGLFAQGGVTKARGGQSYHNFGLAIDICIITEAGQADFNVTRAIANVGKKHGWDWGFDVVGAWDKPHFQNTFGKSVRELCIARYPERAKILGYSK
jgi:LAS superfamily LD-carboxypeptidase LdcB